VRGAIEATGRKRLLISGLLTEACVTFAALSALADGFDVFVVADACGGLTPTSHTLALRRLEARGATMTSWIQVLLELQRDWTRKETYEGARSIVAVVATRGKPRFDPPRSDVITAPSSLGNLVRKAISASRRRAFMGTRYVRSPSPTLAASYLTSNGVGRLEGERCHGDCAVAAGGRWHGATARDEQILMIMRTAVGVHH
jgi:hypothetical protein